MDNTMVQIRLGWRNGWWFSGYKIRARDYEFQMSQWNNYLSFLSVLINKIKNPEGFPDYSSMLGYMQLYQQMLTKITFRPETVPA